ncbi:MAG: YqgE/AlgH family protein [Proteobacteria bacterium]|nr:YqgE/AlgH family protein [Pseudomonadota bacterium]
MTLDTCLKHHFLLAMPGLAGEYFGNTISYICEHNEEGAMGFMVNRPMRLTVAELLEQLGIATTLNLQQCVFEGGPVKTERGFILHSDEVQYDASLPLGNGLMLSTARQTLEAIGAGVGPARYLVALGYAGWGSGQLENELLQNAWLSCPADLDILFDVPFEQRVTKAAASLGIDFRLMSTQAGHA